MGVGGGGTRGEGGGVLNMTKNMHFVRRFIENATISDTFKDRQQLDLSADFTLFM